MYHPCRKAGFVKPANLTFSCTYFCHMILLAQHTQALYKHKVQLIRFRRTHQEDEEVTV